MEDSLITKEQAAEIIRNSMSDMKVKIAEQVKKEMERIIAWQMEDIISKEMRTILQNEVKACMEPMKAELIQNVQNAFVGIGQVIQNAIMEKAKENLKQSWNISKVFEGIFK